MPEDADTHPLLAVGGGTGDGWVLGGRYRVLERVGRGGMAEVFRAHDELLDRDVAVKVFRTILDDPDGATNGPARRELELQVMAGLNHPNLITLYDGSVTGDGPPYLVLEYVDGPDLASRLKDGRMPEAEVREIGADLADALAYVHAHGLVHRDVKPANILLGAGPGRSGSDRARLSDFGIVRMIGRPQMTSIEMTVGTAYYIAPEQARGSSVGPEADVYALGLVLLEALSGVRAFDGPMHEALAARLATTPRIPADLPAPWPGLLSAMTAMDPAARPDAATVAHELRSSAPTAVLAGLAAPAAAVASVPPVAAAAAAERTAPPVGGRRRFHPALLIAAAVFLVAAVALGAFLLNPAGSGGPAAPDQTAPPSQRASAPAQHHSTTAPAATVKQPSTSARPSSTHPKKPTTTTSATTRPAAPGGGASTSTSAPPSSSSAPVSSSSAAPSTPPAAEASSTAAAVGGTTSSSSSSSSPPAGG